MAIEMVSHGGGYGELESMQDKRAKYQKQQLIAKLAPLWRKGDTLVPYELVAPRGVPLEEPKVCSAEDTPASIAGWAVDSAAEYMHETGADKRYKFTLHFGGTKLPFFLDPESEYDGTSPSALISQIMAHKENEGAMYHESMRQMQKVQSEWLARVAESNAQKDVTIAKLMADQLAMAQTYRDLMDTKYLRDQEMRGIERRESRYDLASGKLLGLLDGVATLAGPKLLEVAEQKLGDSTLDKLADLCTEEERQALGKLLARVQTRALEAQARHAAQNGNGNGQGH